MLRRRAAALRRLILTMTCLSRCESLKTCRSCLAAKPIDEFYAHAQMSDGHINQCKNCVRERVRAHRSANLEKIREYDRQRNRTDKGRAGARHYSKTVNGKAAKLCSLQAWRKRNRLKTRAYNSVQEALSRGRLTRKPCEACGADKSQAHHDDYSKRLEVRWLCCVHHRVADAERRERERDGSQDQESPTSA